MSYAIFQCLHAGVTHLACRAARACYACVCVIHSTGCQTRAVCSLACLRACLLAARACTVQEDHAGPSCSQLAFEGRITASCVRAGGLLSEDSPFLDVVREGLKLALPSAELTHPRVEPALGAALLVQQRLIGPPLEEGGGPEGAARSGDAPQRDPFGSPLLSPLRTPDGLHRHRHHRRTPSSLGARCFALLLPF